MKLLSEPSMKKRNSDSPDVEVKGLIFDIQPLSVHDGPGIRTLIFMKGCPLNCKWCSNPESQHRMPQLMYKEGLCDPDCGRCKDESGLIHNAGRIVSDLSNVPDCPHHATSVCGREITPGELMAIIKNDRPFFGEAGGITFSGGEPFSQSQFVQVVLEQCRASAISTAVETSLFVPFHVIEKALPFINFFMFDIKIMDPMRHREYCGVDNGIILENIRKLVQVAEIPLLPRFPLIPGINDDQVNIRQTAEFLRSNQLVYINMLPYMKFGIGKYDSMGKKYELHAIQPPDEAGMNRIKDIFSEYDIYCL